MSQNRMVSTRFWNDTFIREELNPLDRYLFLYFLTNNKTNISGIYENSLSTISAETGIEKETLIKMMGRLKGKIHYIDGWIYIRNFIKYQNQNSPAIKKGIEREKSEIPDNIKEKINEIEGLYTLSHLTKPNLTQLNLTKPNLTKENETEGIETVEDESSRFLTTESNEQKLDKEKYTDISDEKTKNDVAKNQRPPSDLEIVEKYFIEKYEKKYGNKPDWVFGKDRSLIKQLLVSQKVDVILKKIDMYFENEYWFNKKSGRNFGLFRSHYNEIVEIEKPYSEMTAKEAARVIMRKIDERKKIINLGDFV